MKAVSAWNKVRGVFRLKGPFGQRFQAQDAVTLGVVLLCDGSPYGLKELAEHEIPYKRLGLFTSVPGKTAQPL